MVTHCETLVLCSSFKFSLDPLRELSLLHFNKPTHDQYASRIISTHTMEIVQPTASHTHTIIFLHGRGSDGPEFASEFFVSRASNKKTLPEMFPQIKWVRCVHCTTPLLVYPSAITHLDILPENSRKDCRLDHRFSFSITQMEHVQRPHYLVFVHNALENRHPSPTKLTERIANSPSLLLTQCCYSGRRTLFPLVDLAENKHSSQPIFRTDS